MDTILQNAFVSGYERLASWADLLDRINVFPVPDSDTGKNLKISLAPLRQISITKQDTIQKILISATGNSGNIAALFFSRFLDVDSPDKLFTAAQKGNEYAWHSIADPKHGTMLTVFDRLVQVLGETSPNEKDTVIELVDQLKQAVLSTTDFLPALKEANVVDAGALGMFIFFEVFFKCLIDSAPTFLPIIEIFAGKLKRPLSSGCFSNENPTYCVDTTISLDGLAEDKVKQLSQYGESVVAIPEKSHPEKSHLKIHLHTDNRDKLRGKLESMGDIVSWSDENMIVQMEKLKSYKGSRDIHIMTDAAGSVTREDALELGITLLDSYIVFQDRSVPETLCKPSELYQKMRSGETVSTAQASLFERHQCYSNILDQYEKVLYLCVGSIYSGNYDVVNAWKKENDPDDRLKVIDTGTASGSLGTIAISAAKYANQNKKHSDVIRFAGKAVNKCREFVFLERLKYLVAGGRLSKTSGVLGDLLHMKPVISPTKEGAQKLGVVRNKKGQVKFALEMLSQYLERDAFSFVMLEYSDNRAWVKDTVIKEIKLRYPNIEIMLQPLSLTSGTHMGPGTWGVAIMPDWREL